MMPHCVRLYVWFRISESMAVALAVGPMDGGAGSLPLRACWYHGSAPTKDSQTLSLILLVYLRACVTVRRGDAVVTTEVKI